MIDINLDVDYDTNIVDITIEGVDGVAGVIAALEQLQEDVFNDLVETANNEPSIKAMVQLAQLMSPDLNIVEDFKDFTRREIAEIRSDAEFKITHNLG